jgi:hypothetical protein
MADKKKKQIVAAVEYGEGKDKRNRWPRIGVAFENQDGSWNLLFDFWPARSEGITIQLRDFDKKDE